ncbi:unnamed protein product [Mytilus coruscus]|uniref:UMOD/GP2/OIT3-like D8C domain-containing protein n=1 Tax=Mytilus coruscus TaxID=42192 RepID=A0A6J8BCD6_MYTCO|nr:unnamed protein product [Mytilus coruscus]CAC5381263.1 unnamed protein product [Mytilus coruscus]
MCNIMTRSCILEAIFILAKIQIVLGENVCLNVTVLPDISKRGTGCLGTELSEMVCDRQLNEGWYIAQHEGEILQMPTSCPSTLACGTSGGIWLNGDHPTDFNTTITVNACRRGFSSDDNECCAEIIPIQVKNCGNFYAYYLKYTTGCSQAYCFGSHMCPVTTASTTTISSTATTDVFSVTDNKTALLSTIATSHGQKIVGENVCLNVTVLPDISKRGTGCLGTELSEMVCDRQLNGGWYIAQHEGEILQMPTSCPSTLACGTSGGIWLNGDHPTDFNTTITVNACRRGFSSDDNECCAEIIPIQVKNCGNFYAYYLKYTTGCSQAYCFGSHMCPVTTASTTTISSTATTNVFSVTDNKTALLSTIATSHGQKIGDNICLNVTALDDVSKRGTSCLGTELSNMVCDRQLVEGWYVASHEGELLEMPTTCPSMLSCGTSGGIWLNGNHPKEVNSTVTVAACRRGFPTDVDECCAERIPIQVRNCGSFYAYYLKYTTGCHHGYCFGNHACPQTTTSTTTAPATAADNVSNVSNIDPVCSSAISISAISKRGTGCIGSELTEMVCDRRLAEGWYYAEYDGDMTNMATTCPSMMSCGTAGSIWLNGEHPYEVNKTVTIDACRRGFPTEENECCVETFPIQVKNCGTFYAYYLRYTSTCDQAYCFGSHNCPVQTTQKGAANTTPLRMTPATVSDHGHSKRAKTDDIGVLLSILIFMSICVTLFVAVFLYWRFRKGSPSQKKQHIIFPKPYYQEKQIVPEQLFKTSKEQPPYTLFVSHF